MYFFVFRSSPKLGGEYHDKYGGAYVNCWISGDSHEKAEKIARHYIEDCGWTVEAKEEDRFMYESHYANAEDGLENYRKAEREGSCFVFHTYPAC